MQKGFNSDIQIKGFTFHVQTEDWGHENPFIVTKVFRQGAVIKTIKNPYSTVLKEGPVNDTQALVLALKKQHTDTIDDLILGKIF